MQASGFDEGFISDDVPFSCCNPTSMRPCIHHDVHDNDLHYNYDYRTSMTINTKGCATTLMEYYGEWVLMKAGAIAIGLSFFQVILVVFTRILQTSISMSLYGDNPEATAIGYLCSCNCKRPKDILSIPHIGLQSKSGFSKTDDSLEKQTGSPEMQLVLPTDVEDHGDYFDSSFDDFEHSLSQAILPADQSGFVPMEGRDHRKYINYPSSVSTGGSDNSKYAHDPLYENMQTGIDIRGVRIPNVPLEEPLYENITSREDKLYELIDVDEEHIYHDEEVEHYLREKGDKSCYDNLKNKAKSLSENLYNATDTYLNHPNTLSRFGEMMQRDHSNPDENISFHSILSVPKVEGNPTQFIKDPKKDHINLQKGSGHHNDMNKDLDASRFSYEFLVSGHQPIPSNTPSPSPSFTTTQETQQREGQQQQQLHPLLPPPPTPWIAKMDAHISEPNPNETKNATENVSGPRRGSLFKVRTSTGSYLSMHFEDRVDN